MPADECRTDGEPECVRRARRPELGAGGAAPVRGRRRRGRPRLVHGLRRTLGRVRRRAVQGGRRQRIRPLVPPSADVSEDHALACPRRPLGRPAQPRRLVLEVRPGWRPNRDVAHRRDHRLHRERRRGRDLVAAQRSAGEVDRSELQLGRDRRREGDARVHPPGVPVSEPGGLVKALIREVKGSGSVTCAFNPTQYTISKTATWKQESQLAAASAPDAEFIGTRPRELRMTLLFDAWGSGRGVAADVDQLLAWTNPTESSISRGAPRPPWLTFTWGSNQFFTAFLASATAEYKLFDADGTPLRAEVTVAFTEVPVPQERQNP